MGVEWVWSSSVMILLVVLIRFLFRKKMQPCVRYALWMAVALRLLVPVSFSGASISILNLLPGQISAETNWNREAVRELPEETEVTGEKNTKAQKSPVQKPAPETEDILKIQADEGRALEYQESVSWKVSSTDIDRLLQYGWISGVILWSSVLLAVNFHYGRRLKRSRKRIPEERLPIVSGIPVYTSEIILTPCLTGLFYPAIYVTKQAAEEEKTLFFVLCHENVHYRHHDNWWVLVRNLCLCLHWYNPLVWLAACLSRQDGELSCDEKVLERIGKDAGADYGRTLLKLSTAGFAGINGWQISTTMAGNKKQLERRLQMIVNMPGKAGGMRILTMILMSVVLAVTFTGRSFAASKLISGEIHAEQNLSFEKLVQEVNKALEETISNGEMPLNEERDAIQKEKLPDMDTDPETGWLTRRKEEGDGRFSITYYRYDEEGQLHMMRYTEEDPSPDAVFNRLDLTYVDDGGMYTLPAVEDGTDRNRILTGMAKKSLEELYQWTGEKVDTACFQVSNLGGVYFGMSPEDIMHSRIFLSRYFGMGTNCDPEYNLGDCISSITIASGRKFWFSPVLWHIFPERMEEMTDEEVIIWYLERIPMMDACKVKRVEKNYEDMWTIQIQSGEWFEVVYDANVREIVDVTGPYSDYPIH